jgi:glyoxylase-like metal-dependent hydrolase (beta-lactamase superfamily II)
VACIEALGLVPQDVGHIILTHLDYDHAAGIADFAWATVHVYAPELHAALYGKSWRDRIRYDRRQLARHEHWESYDDAGGDTWYDLRMGLLIHAVRFSIQITQMRRLCRLLDHALVLLRDKAHGYYCC